MTNALQINSPDSVWHPGRGGPVTVSRGSREVKAFEVYVRRLPEGVLLATSPQIPGLILECGNLAELMDEILAWAPELARDNGVLARGESATIVIRADTI